MWVASLLAGVLTLLPAAIGLLMGSLPEQTPEWFVPVVDALQPVLHPFRSRFFQAAGGLRARLMQWRHAQSASARRRDKSEQIYATFVRLGSQSDWKSKLAQGRPSGLHWVQLDCEQQQLSGRELVNHPELATALQLKTTFTQAEWESFRVMDLSYGDWIKSGEAYFAPTSEAQSSQRRLSAQLRRGSQARYGVTSVEAQRRKSSLLRGMDSAFQSFLF